MDRFFPALVPISLLIGMLLGGLLTLPHALSSLVFASVTFMGGLKMDFNSFAEVIKKPKAMLVSMFMLRLLFPLWALLISHLLFPNDVYIRTGLLLFSVLPIGINSVLWTMMAKGKVPLSLTVVLLDTFLAPILVPASILLLTGQLIELDAVGMMINLLLVIVIPTFTGVVVNQLSKGELPKKWNSKTGILSKLGIILVMLINGTNVREHFMTIDFGFILIVGAMIFLSVSGYLIAWFLGASVFKLETDDLKATVFTGLRNINVGILIAIGYFPTAVSVPIISTVLFQQMVCAFFANKLLVHFQKKDAMSEA